MRVNVHNFCRTERKTNNILQFDEFNKNNEARTGHNCAYFFFSVAQFHFHFSRSLSRFVWKRFSFVLYLLVGFFPTAFVVCSFFFSLLSCCHCQFIRSYIFCWCCAGVAGVVVSLAGTSVCLRALEIQIEILTFDEIKLRTAAAAAATAVASTPIIVWKRINLPAGATHFDFLLRHCKWKIRRSANAQINIKIK